MLRGGTEAGDTRNVLRPGAKPLFLTTADHQGNRHHQVGLADERANTLWPPDLVRRKDDKITASLCDIERNTTGRLNRIGNKNSARRLHHIGNLGNRLDNARLIVGHVHSHQRQTVSLVMRGKRGG